MKITNILLGSTILAITLVSCKNNSKADGYGNFEAVETTISAEGNGKLIQFNLNEGDLLKQGDLVGVIDTIQLALKKQQIEASKKVIISQSKGILSQLDVLKAQLNTAKQSQKRIEYMVSDSAATQQQLDDINGKVAVINNQMSSVIAQNEPTLSQLKNTDAQLKEIEDKLQKSNIINPINGTVLVKYVEPNEIVSFGKPLYKIADLTTMQLRVYVSENQLANINIGQEVVVKIDNKKAMKTYSGIITWIASEAEFTPKIIQTKEERVNLVYAVKIDVQNDGSLKIGMPAEMWITNKSE
jgi:HlyD family secretion protein